MSGGLLRRITSQVPTGGREPTNALGTIAEHLRVLLNARQGDAATVPSYGLVDFTQLVHSAQSAQAIGASIRATILEFEPRLKNVVVRNVDQGDGLVLKFEITAALADKSSREVLRFKTQVFPGGRIELA